MNKSTYRGILAIGDPHLASRVPGFRKDEYPATILRKLKWCLDYASTEQLLPCLLGDIFHWPRDNANWLLGATLDLLTHEVLAISGNHDCAENVLGADDSLSVLVKAGRLRLLDQTGPWRGVMNGRPVVVGGTSWGQTIPTEFRAEAPSGGRPLVVWLVHDNVSFPGYDAGHIAPRAIVGIDVVINGHIHQPRDDVVTETTVWLNPGNIARVKRSDSSRASMPGVLRLGVEPPDGAGGEPPGTLWRESDPTANENQRSGRGWSARRIPVPHEPFDQVFHAAVAAESIPVAESAFVHGLAELVARRTETGAGLREFLGQNMSRFDERVATEIMTLAEEVLQDGSR